MNKDVANLLDSGRSWANRARQALYRGEGETAKTCLQLASEDVDACYSEVTSVWEVKEISELEDWIDMLSSFRRGAP